MPGSACWSRWCFSLAIGFLNGWIVVKTGIPSFLITLGTFFMLQGHQYRA